MVEQVISYRASDGKTFDTPVEAHKHDIRERISKDKPELRSSLSAIMAEAFYLADILAPLQGEAPKKVEDDESRDDESPAPRKDVTDWTRPEGPFTCKVGRDMKAPDGWTYGYSRYQNQADPKKDMILVDLFYNADEEVPVARISPYWPSDEMGGGVRDDVSVDPCVDHAPPGGNKFCDHDFYPTQQGLIDRCIKCWEERA